MRDVIRQAHGHVLIGGLGLGVVHHLIANLSKGIKSITTIEKEQDVIDLVSPTLNNHHVNWTIQCGDLFPVVGDLKNDRTKYDFAFFDIWTGTGEYTWVEYVVPLRRLCRRKIPQGQVLCWNEDEMKGQLRDALRRAAYIDGPTVHYYEPLRVFAQNCMISHPKFSKDYMATMKTAQQMEKYWNAGADNKGLEFLIERYLKPGTDTWERDFGQLWDQHITERQK
jgi:spermidine synthase